MPNMEAASSTNPPSSTDLSPNRPTSSPAGTSKRRTPTPRSAITRAANAALPLICSAYNGSNRSIAWLAIAVNVDGR